MAKSSGSEGLVNHYNAVRLRVNGSASLQMKYLSLDAVKESVLLSLTITSTTNKELTRIANFIQQRAQLQLMTTEIDEIFVISKIVIYAKSVATDYPGNN